MKYWSDPWSNEPEQRKREKKIKISTRRRGRGGRGEGGEGVEREYRGEGRTYPWSRVLIGAVSRIDGATIDIEHSLLVADPCQ